MPAADPEPTAPALAAIIVAAGSSRRMGFDKLAADLGGQPVLARTIAAFRECPSVSELVLVCSDDNADWVKQVAGQFPASHPGARIPAVVQGGAERHLSVWNGLQAVTDDAKLIAVHDAARPLVTSSAISRCAAAAAKSGAATLGHPITDTVKRCNENGIVIDSVDRSMLWAMETPQIFRAGLLRDAYRRILENRESVTDEVSAVHALGHPVTVIPTGAPNPKITYPADLALALAVLRASQRNS